MLYPLFALCLAVAPPAQPASITVVGTSKVSFRPNQLVLSFLITATQRDAASVKRVTDEKLSKLTKAVRDAGVLPTNIIVNDGGPSPEYRGNEIISYSMNRVVQLTVTDLSKVDDVISAVVKLGGTQTGQVLLQNTEHDTFETKARIIAATMAKERAKGLVEALGGKLGLPVVVTDHTPPIENVAAGTFLVAADGTVITPFVNRELLAASTVTVQFTIEPPQ